VLTADITVTMTYKRAIVAVIPDDDAHQLRTQIEAARVIDGHEWNSRFTHDSWAAEYTRQVFAAVISYCRAGMAKGPRDVLWDVLKDAAGMDPRFNGYIVGQSGYDFKLAEWRDYDNTQDLHIPGAVWSTAQRGVTYGGDIEN
jgi:hypothetical protein